MILSASVKASFENLASCSHRSGESQFEASSGRCGARRAIGKCCSARKLDADRRINLLILFDS